MDFADRIKELASRIPQQIDHIQTEEATKSAMIMPFLSALGYDVFNPTEVVPEFIADVGTKKGEKVDYAIKKDGKIIILVECKWSGSDLQSKYSSQLYRYFSTTEARFAILTNGLIYQFYSDIDEANKMDKHPFFVFNIMDFHSHEIKELKKFTKAAFSLEDILTTASTLKYANAVKAILERELENPSEPFVRFFASQIFEGRLTKPVIEQFTKIVQDARKQFFNEKISERLRTALSANESVNDDEEVDIDDNKIDDHKADSGIVTTEEEKEGFHIVKAVLRQHVDVKRVFMRDTKRYCGILLDDSNRKIICRLHFNYSQKYLGIFRGKEEERIPIEDVNDIFQYADQLVATANSYQ